MQELTYAEEQKQQAWAKRLRKLLLDIEQVVKVQVGALPEPHAIRYTEQYRALLNQAEVEFPPPDPQ